MEPTQPFNYQTSPVFIMFARAYSIVLFLIFALPLLAAATPSGLIEARQGQCNTGPIQCCDQTISVCPIYFSLNQLVHFFFSKVTLWPAFLLGYLESSSGPSMLSSVSAAALFLSSVSVATPAVPTPSAALTMLSYVLGPML